MILVSIFRDAASYVPRYLKQVEALQATGMPVTVVCAEGDSEDNTYWALEHAGFEPLKVEHGGPKFASVDDPTRWRQIAAVDNVVWTAAIRQAASDETVVYVESDLIWDAETMLSLDAHMVNYQAIATMSMRGPIFYDVWGHVKDGVPFQSHYPFHPMVRNAVTEIDSAGSCFAVHSSVARHVEFSMVDCIRGVGRSLRKAGIPLMLDPTLAVHHPRP